MRRSNWSGTTAREQQPIRCLYCGPPQAIEAAFLRCIEQYARQAPLRPIVVFVPTSLARLYLRRQLALQKTPLVNVRFSTLDGFVQEHYPLLTPTPRAPLPPGAARLLLHQLVPSRLKDSYFDAVADVPGFQLALLATIDDLREACIDPADLQKAITTRRMPFPSERFRAKVESLLAIWDVYDAARRKHGYADLIDMYAELTAHLARWPLLQRSPICLLYGFYDLKGIQFRLITRLAELCSLLYFMPFEECSAYDYARPTHDSLHVALRLPWKELTSRADDEPDTDLSRLQRWLFDTPPAERPRRDGSVRVISMPTTGSEPELVVQLVAEALAKRTDAHRIAVLTRDAELAARVREHCRDSGICCVDIDHEPLTSTSLGQLLVGLLELAAESDDRQRFDRSDVVHLLELAETLNESRAQETAPYDTATLFETLSRQAGIVSGAAEWHERLKRLDRTLREQERTSNDVGHADDSEDLQLKRQALRLLRQRIRTLFSACDALQHATSWTEQVKAYENLCRKLLPRPTAAVRQALDALFERLRALTPLAPPHAPLPLFADTVRSTLDTIPATDRSTAAYMREGIIVGDIMRARGARFDCVVVPGVSGRKYPLPVRQDPVLLDEERRWINEVLQRTPAVYELPLKRRRVEEERLLFRLALASAERCVVLSYPRHETGRGRTLLPSAFILDVLRAIGHTDVSFAALADAETGRFGGFERIALNPANRDPDRWFMTHRDVLVLEVLQAASTRTVCDAAPWRAASELNPLLQRALEGEHIKWSQQRLTAFDGALSHTTAKQLWKHLAPENRFSVSHIDDFLSCSYAFFLAYALGLEPDEDPTRSYRADPRAVGTLAHEILQQAFAALRHPTPEPGPEVDAKVRRIAAKAIRELEQRGIPGFPLIWEIEKGRLVTGLIELVRSELRRLAQQNMRSPRHLEQAFGMGEVDPFLLPLQGGVALEIRGRIDRIDVDQQGQWYVVDYKRRKGAYRRDDPGMQLPAYVAAAAETLKLRPEDFGGMEYVFYQADDDKTVLRIDNPSTYEEVLTFVRESGSDAVHRMHQGQFIQAPSDEGCRYCPFGDVCLGLQHYLAEYKDLSVER